MLRIGIAASAVLALSFGLAGCSGDSGNSRTTDVDGGPDMMDDDSDDDDVGNSDDDNGDDDEGDAGSEPTTPPSLRAPDETVTTEEDTPITLTKADLMLPAGLPDGIAIKLVTAPEHGSLDPSESVDLSDDSVTYTPDPNFVGTDKIDYEITLGDVMSNVGTITIRVTPVNDPPTAEDDAYEVAEGDALAADVSDNDNDPDEDDELEYEVVTEPTAGMLMLNPDGSFRYVPTDQTATEDSFEYEVCDPEGECDQATATISIGLVNDPPVAVNDAYVTTRGTSISVDATNGVQMNDTDPDDTTLESTLVVPPMYGTVTFNADGSFDYENDGSSGVVDEFEYETCDPAGQCSSAVVTINILRRPDNTPPIAVTDRYQVTQGATLVIAPPNSDTILDNDSDAEGPVILTLQPVTLPKYGSLVLNPPDDTLNEDGSFEYRHQGGPERVDGFSYEICDTDGLCAIGAVVINIRHAMSVNDDIYAIVEGGTLNQNVTDNDVFLDPFPLDAVSLVTGVANGVLVLNPDGSFTYTHDGGVSESDSFQYEACNTNMLCEAANVTIVITAQPVVNDDTYEVNEGSSLTANVLDNDADPLGEVLTVTKTSDPTGGTLTLNADGSFTYTPDQGTDTDSFDYQACRPSDSACVGATASITVLNLPPIAVPDNASVPETDPIVVVPVLNNDSDPGGDPITVTQIVVPPQYGLASVSGGGTTTTYSFNGFEKRRSNSDYYVYRVCDDEGACSDAAVGISIVPEPIQCCQYPTAEVSPFGECYPCCQYNIAPAGFDKQQYCEVVALPAPQP